MKPREGQNEIQMGCRRTFWSCLALGALRAPLRAVLGWWGALEVARVIGASRGAPGADLGLPGGSFWSFFGCTGLRESFGGGGSSKWPVHIWRAAVAKELLTSDFETCVRLSKGLRASLEKDA